MAKLLQQCFLFFIVVVIPGHNLGNCQMSVNRTIGPTLVIYDDHELSYSYDAKLLCNVCSYIIFWHYPLNNIDII